MDDIVNGRVSSADGVEIFYSARGSGRTALIFIHGGLADRTFWDSQLAGLGGLFRVVALDLAGHGTSGRGRSNWTIPAFARDVEAVALALDLRRIVLVGNSLGGAVALDAAALLRPRVIGVVGVDTLHDVNRVIDTSESRERAAAFRADFAGSCRAMVRALFHQGQYPQLQSWAEDRMGATPAEVAAGLMEGFGGYDLAAAFRSAGVPIRAINGDLWPTLIEANRAVAPDFDAVIMDRTGHYPMLEKPDEFNRLLTDVVQALAASRGEPGD